MTLPVPCPPSSSSEPLAIPSRKRRRRAPASGASDDCFACIKRNTKCDRRRPYCSQCLEVGKECSGYRIQLTWGVGVASRGKLRGLSLPVARSAPAPRSPPRSRPRSTSTVLPRDRSLEDDVKVKLEAPSSMPVTPINQFTQHDFVNMAPIPVTTASVQMPEWNMTVSHDFRLQNYQQPGLAHQIPLPQLHSLHTNHSLSMSSSLDSMNSYAESEYTNSPVSQSYQNEDIPFQQSPLPMYNSYSSTNSPINHSPVPGMMTDNRGPTSCPDQYYAHSDISSSLSSHQNFYDVQENRQRQGGHHKPNSVFYEDEMLT